ncbi:hypothetical protein M413DRAFT_27514 [Hebeloma cylindrosporum]|uniref:F-box domain-containing protein n=1 Tax=Hebeloma cylindrosporum TaxID=76867 RepID=A0A0C2YLS9_HEBCY|nr:hypothetical protein M413DRAFT_27514 [Hebeloma cylindrosporum h7]
MSLDWKDVLRLRQTCKHLSQVTREKSIWVRFFHVFNVFHPWSPLRLERPLQFYTAQELEHLVVRRTNEELRRKTRTKLRFSLIRRLPLRKSEIRALTLINGGRWLLTVSRFGSVSYYDLETQEPVKRVLIPAPQLGSPDGQCTAKIAVDMDYESALLSFNLALYIRKVHMSTRVPIQLIQVWHVTLELDDQNHGRSLSAKRLSSFYRENCGELQCLSLLGTFVAFGVITRPPQPSYVSVVDWAKAANIHNPSHRRPATSLSYLRKVIYCHNPGELVRVVVHLLPGNRILVVSESTQASIICLYDMLSIETTANIPPANFSHSSSPTWEHKWQTCLGSFQSHGCANRFNDFRLVFHTTYTLYGITIPCDSGEDGLQPELVKLMTGHSSFENVSHLGYNSAIVMDTHSPLLYMLHYPWPDASSGSASGPSNSVVGIFDKKNWRRPKYSAFDECSGRLVVDTGLNEVVVYDFARS